MTSDSLWHGWKRRVLAFFFIVQYHYRLSLLHLRFKARTLSPSDINARTRDYWHMLCQALTTYIGLPNALKKAKHRLESEQITAALHFAKNKFESERFQTLLSTAKRRLEKTIFTEEVPTQPLDLSALKTTWRALDAGKIQRVVPDKLKTAWHSLETGPLPRVAPKTLKAARHPWKTLRALRHPKTTLLTLSMLSLFLVALFNLCGLTGRAFNTIQTAAISIAPQFVTSAFNLAAQQSANINASRSLIRISQLDANEYLSQSEYDTWAYSACSTAAMTEVFNAYGNHYRITDVLKVESAIGEITPPLGLVENVGVANTAARFGFQTTWGNSWTLDQVKSYANGGHPVLAGWPPDRYSGGHIVVVTGGDASSVYLADSSLWNRHVLSNAQFLQWWAGFAAVMIPE